MHATLDLLPAAFGPGTQGPGRSLTSRAPKSAKSVDLRGHRKVNLQKSVVIGHSIGKKFAFAEKKVK